MKQDRLSNLPESILHEILSRLPEEDVARTGVLSKAWAQTLSRFPNLSFSDTRIIRNPHYPHEFIDNVERTLLRFRNQGLAIEQLNLSMIYYGLYLVSKYVDLWLKLAIESGVEVLKLRSSYSCHQHYIFPMGILEAKSLTKLVLMGRIKVDLSFMNHSTKFLSLQGLELEGVVFVNEKTLNHFISRCPLIEYITMSHCTCVDDQGDLNELESLSMCDLPKLKRLDIQGIKQVSVDSPCLENLRYSPGNYSSGHFLFDNDQQLGKKIYLCNCKNLRGLSLQSLSASITNEWFLKLFSNFPFLENLKLKYCIMSERINISSVQLKMLNLSICSSLKTLNIDAPNMVSCVYATLVHDPKSFSFSRCSSQLKVNVSINGYRVNSYDLRKFIQNFKPKIALASVSLTIDYDPDDALNPIVLQVSSPPPRIKDLVLQYVPSNETMFLPIVYELLSSCCPTTISIHIGLYFYCCRAFVEFLYEMLKGRKVDKCFCRSSNTTCWWHDIKHVEATSSVNMDDNNVDFNTMLDTLFSIFAVPGHILRFRLEF